MPQLRSCAISQLTDPHCGHKKLSNSLLSSLPQGYSISMTQARVTPQDSTMLTCTCKPAGCFMALIPAEAVAKSIPIGV